MSSVLGDLKWRSKRRRYIMQLYDQGLTKRHIARHMMRTQAHVEKVIDDANRKRKGRQK